MGAWREYSLWGHKEWELTDHAHSKVKQVILALRFISIYVGSDFSYV